MNTIRYDIFDEYERSTIEQEVYSLEISSTKEENNVSDIVYNIINTLFEENKIVYRAIMDHHRISDELQSIKHLDHYYFEGKTNKHLFGLVEVNVYYQELFLEVNDDETLQQIIQNSSLYIDDLKCIYIIKKDKQQEVMKLIKENVHSGESNIDILWEYLECLIESRGYDGIYASFAFMYREEYDDIIKSIVNSYSIK